MIKSDNCWDGNDMNNIGEQNCDLGCMIKTRVGYENDNEFDEIERGCITPSKSVVGCSHNKTQVTYTLFFY